MNTWDEFRNVLVTEVGVVDSGRGWHATVSSILLPAAGSVQAGLAAAIANW